MITQAKRVRNLIIKAKKVYKTDLKFTDGIIDPLEDGRYRAVGNLWNYIPYGKKGHRHRSERYDCGSLEEALEKLQKLSEEYPNDRDAQILIDDLGQ